MPKEQAKTTGERGNHIQGPTGMNITRLEPSVGRNLRPEHKRMPTPTPNDLKRLISAYPRTDYAGAGVSGLTGALRVTANEAQRLLTVHLMKTICQPVGGYPM